MAEYYSMRGVKINMDEMRRANENTVAVTGGSVRMNARGDLLKSDGTVLKRREQIETEYNRNPEGKVKNVSLKNIQPDTFVTPTEAINQLTGAAQAAAAGIKVDNTPKVHEDAEAKKEASKGKGKSEVAADIFEAPAESKVDLEMPASVVGKEKGRRLVDTDD